jgi:hypothetical protein
VQLEKDGELKDVNTFFVDGAYFLNKDGTFSFVSIDKLNGYKWADKKEYFDIEIGETNDPLYLKIETVNWTTKILENKLTLNVDMKVKINYNHTNLSEKEIENKLKEIIKKDIYDTYIYLYKNIDIYHFSDYLYRVNKSTLTTNDFILNIDLTIKNSIYKY